VREFPSASNLTPLGVALVTLDAATRRLAFPFWEELYTDSMITGGYFLLNGSKSNCRWCCSQWHLAPIDGIPMRDCGTAESVVRLTKAVL
jgi:hypothetical protein